MKQFKANNKFSIEWNEYWSHNIEALSKATFGGFLNFEADAGLAEGTSYSVLLSPGVRIGDRIQILAMLLTTDEKWWRATCLRTTASAARIMKNSWLTPFSRPMLVSSPLTLLGCLKWQARLNL